MYVLLLIEFGLSLRIKQSTANPGALYVLSSSTFRTLHTVPSTSLELYTINAASSSVTATSMGDTTSNFTPSTEHQSPQPVFALSRRLLAYASSYPFSSASAGLRLCKEPHQLSFSSSPIESEVPGSCASSSPFGFKLDLRKITNMTQADVGHAALKVGESMFSGMKFLGGMALEVSKHRVISSIDPINSGNAGNFVSRSAPNRQVDVEGQHVRGRRHSSSSSTHDQVQSITVAPFKRSCVEEGYYITVVDLAPLLPLQTNVGQPVKIGDFMVSRKQPVAKLEFSSDGISIGVVLKDGQSLKIFRLQPNPYRLAQPEITGASESEISKVISVHVYDLRRGRTSAVVEHIDWAKDGRYVGVGTRNRTVHIYALNPYGGKIDIKSHLEGRVRNVETVVSSSALQDFFIL